MKKVIAWVKAHLVPVICIAVILIVLPVGYVVSSAWGSGIRTDRQEAAAAELSRVRSNETVTYTIPPILPGETAIEQRAAPNAQRTAWFRELAEARGAEAATLVQETIEFNRRGRGPLVEGLFPEPGSTRERQVRALEMAERVIGTPAKPSAYALLLESINAGPPADRERVAQLLADFRERELERHQSETGRAELDPAEGEELQRALTDRRIGEYQRVARARSLYATPEVIHSRSRDAGPGSGGRPAPGGAGAGGTWSSLPDTVPSQPPELDTAFQWQFDYWVVQDILAAIDAANTRDGVRADVELAAVKRLDELLVAPLIETATADPGRGGRGGGPDDFGFDDGMGGGAAGADPAAAIIEPDRTASITGRTGSNGLYDLRRVRLTAVVASAQLDEVLRAFAETNFISVLSMNVREVDAWEELSDGYFYGPDHVVRVTFELECLYLRAWTVPFMPPAIRTALGIPDEQPAPDA